MNEEQRSHERIEAGHELVRLGRKPARNSRDIVEEFCDDGLTPKEALEADRQYRVELAQEFRQAIDAVASRQEKVFHRIAREANTLSEWMETCGWCGDSVYSANRYVGVDRQLMCGPCVNGYGLVEGRDYER